MVNKTSLLNVFLYLLEITCCHCERPVTIHFKFLKLPEGHFCICMIWTLKSFLRNFFSLVEILVFESIMTGLRYANSKTSSN